MPPYHAVVALFCHHCCCATIVYMVAPYIQVHLWGQTFFYRNLIGLAQIVTFQYQLQKSWQSVQTFSCNHQIVRHTGKCRTVAYAMPSSQPKIQIYSISLSQLSILINKVWFPWSYFIPLLAAPYNLAAVGDCLALLTDASSLMPSIVPTLPRYAQTTVVWMSDVCKCSRSCWSRTTQV